MVIRQKGGKASAKAKAKREANKYNNSSTASSGADLGNNNNNRNKEDDAAAPRQSKEGTLFMRAFSTTPPLEPEEVIDYIYWMRQCLALVVGVIFGGMKVTGQVGLTTFLSLVILAPASIVRQLQAPLDEDEVSKVGSLVTEGIIPSFALFLLAWIISYTVAL